MNYQTAMSYRNKIEKASSSLDDKDALIAPEMFPRWQKNVNYIIGDRRYDEEVGYLYKCVQAHTSQEGWEPHNTPALWVRVSLDKWPEWIQPTGAQDAYSMGSKVTHNNKHWISNVDNNVWEPGVYGWDEAS